MNYHRHALQFRPEPQRPVRYTTHRTLAHKLRPLIIAGLLGLGIALIVVGTSSLIARLHATQAQLDAAFLQGFASGQRNCAKN